MNGDVLFALALSGLAGLSTAIGSGLALLFKRTNKAFLAVSLGLSAGVMIYVSFVELLAEAQEMLGTAFGEESGARLAVASFFGGLVVAAVIDRLIPEWHNPHEPRPIESMHVPQPQQNKKLMRMGVMTAVAIAVHNFPEGFATFGAALTNPTIGISIAVAVAIHNIPEGISVAVPIYAATGSRKKAFWLSAASGLAEPLGALLGYALLHALLSESFLGVMLGAVAGIMVFISLDELLPAAREYGEGHLAIYGAVAGMAIMAVSLLVL